MKATYWYRLKTPQCRISRDMKKMTRVARSIREMMKNPIQAMDYLSMHGCHYQSRTERENDMSRLIDADLLMRKCEKWLKPKASDEDKMVSVADIAVSTLMEIEEQPTAFDVEKVLNELKHEESEALRRYSESKGTAYAFSDKCSCDNWAKAIEIVKRGGVDEK